jgi:hypothetical protein
VAGRALRRLFAIGVFCASCGALALPMLAQTKEPAVKRAALLKMAEPWPDAEAMTARRVEAENRRLFAAADPFPLTLSADFKTINKDRATEGKKPYPAELTITDDSGKSTTFHVTLRTRGHFRLRATSCSFVPLRVEFKSEETAGTLFDHQKALKLTTHCQNDKVYDQYTLREYLVYRALNLITPRSFRARLTKASYVQSTDGKPVVARYGMFLEDDDDVARRMEGRIMELPRAAFKDVDADALALAMMFEYMIGNTDMSLYALHNIILVQMPDRSLYTVPYDFDLAGLVHPPYAIPARGLSIKTVQERLFRGPCKPVDAVSPMVANFVAKQDEIMGLMDRIPDVDKSSKEEVKNYLSAFYSSIKNEKEAKRIFTDNGCLKSSTM